MINRLDIRHGAILKPLFTKRVKRLRKKGEQDHELHKPKSNREIPSKKSDK